MRTSIRVEKKKLKEEEQKSQAKKEELDLWVRCHSPFFQPPKLDAEQTQQLGKIFIDTMQYVSNSRRTKAFILRRFKNKKNKFFKQKPFGKSKYKMINDLAEWGEREREKKKKEISEERLGISIKKPTVEMKDYAGSKKLIEDIEK